MSHIGKLLFFTELLLHERRGTSDAMDLGGSTGALMVEDIGGTGRTRALKPTRPFVAYTGGKPKG